MHQHLEARRNAENADGYLWNLDVLQAVRVVLRRWCEDMDPQHLDEESKEHLADLDENTWDAIVLYSDLTQTQLGLGQERSSSSTPQPRRRCYRIAGGELEEEQLREQVGGMITWRSSRIQEWAEFRGHRWGTALGSLEEALKTLLLQLEKVGATQWCLRNSFRSRNVWIVKPGTNSKGSGVVCMESLPDLLHYCDAMPNRIVQRYIERPLLFRGRKFDIRQWVLVRSVMPLRIFAFSECYLRICGEDYDIGDLRNRQRHISNWQVNKHGKKSTHGSVASLADLQEDLRYRTGSQTIWADSLWPQLCNIIVQTLRATEEKLEPRAESFELYGFDMMIDEHMNVWLLEVNLSPGCENRAPFLDKMLLRMADRLVDIVAFGKEQPDGEQPDWLKICDDATEYPSGASRCDEACHWTPRDVDLTVYGQPLQVARRSCPGAAGSSPRTSMPPIKGASNRGACSARVRPADSAKEK